MASWTINGTTTSSTYWKARAVVTEQSQNIANNQTTLKVSFQLGRDIVSSYLWSYNTNWYINIGSNQSGEQTLSTWDWDPAPAGKWKEIASRTVTVTHDADGTKKDLNISCKWYNTGVSPSSATVSGKVTLTTIPRATTPTTPINVTMGSNATISLPRASSTFTHNLTYTFGNANGTVATGAGASATWAVPLSLANQVPSGTSGTGTITCKTYSGSTLVGTKSVTFKASVPSSVVPTISNVSLSEANTTVSDRFSVYVQTKSKLKTSFTTSGAYSSKVSSYTVTIGTLKYSGNVGAQSSTVNVTSDYLPNSGTITVTIKVTDSRGRTATNTRTISVVAYSQPTAAISGRRATSAGAASRTGTYLRYNYNYTISPVSNQNSKSFYVQYKRVSDSSWTNLTSGSSSYSANVTNALSGSGILNADYSYDFRIRVSDYFSTIYVNASTISTAYTLVDYHSNGQGISFGKASETNNLLECDMPAKFNKSVDVEAPAWQIPDLSSGSFNDYSDVFPLRYRKNLGIVELCGGVKPKSNISGGTDAHTICTLPSGYRPSRQINVLCQGSGNAVWLCTVGSDGVVAFARYRDLSVTTATGFSGVTTSTWLPIHVMFFAG